jgi:hypothetical protein
MEPAKGAQNVGSAVELPPCRGYASASAGHVLYIGIKMLRFDRADNLKS